jgi:choline dehydrogenase-like flavoprotein
MNTIHCDILIIGSGAAGGVLAGTLAETTGKKIVVVEKGGYYGKEFFNQREAAMNVLYAENGARSTADGAIPVRGGECVGGGTTVNIALCFDPVRTVWEGWKHDHGLQGFSFDDSANDLGVKGLSFTRCNNDIRQRINIHVPADGTINDNNRALQRGCERLGIASKQFPLNMRNCIGCGFCAEGCAYDSKQGTMVTYLADALRNGVQLIHHCTIDSLEFSGNADTLRAVGAFGTVRPAGDGSRPNTVPEGNIHILASLVIVASGAIESPALLQRSRHPDPYALLGKGLVLHPSLPIVGIMEHALTNYRGISGTIFSDHYYASHGFYYECLFGHPVYGSVVLPYIGTEHFELMLKFRQLAGFGVMLIDTVDPHNHVEWDAAEQRSIIHYRLPEADKQRLRFAAQKGIEIMFAAGAAEVLLTSEEPVGPLPFPRFKDPSEASFCSELQFLPHQTTITSAHCQATVKMGEDPQRSMINSRCESHAVKNLLVCDSSSFPASCGANPMVSIMTLARYQALRIAGEWARYER